MRTTGNWVMKTKFKGITSAKVYTLAALLMVLPICGQAYAASGAANPQTKAVLSPAKQAIYAADVHGSEGRYVEAAKGFEKVFATHPQAFRTTDLIHYSSVYAILGEHKKHEELARWMDNNVPMSDDPTDSERPAKAYLLNPAVTNEAMLQRALVRTQNAVATGKKNLHWFHVANGIAHYRLKQYDEARISLAKGFAKGENDENRARQSLALVYATANEFADGKPDAGNQLLADARNAVNNLPKLGDETYFKLWTDILISKMGLAEAEKLAEKY